jgi:general secretion pathway protein M
MSIMTWISRLSAFTLLILLVAALHVILGQPLIDSFREHRASIVASKGMLARYQQLNSSRAQMHGRLQQVQEAYESQGRLLTGQSSQLAGADLQNRLKYLVEANNAELGSMQLLSVREEEGFRRISVTISFTSAIDSLRSIIYEIETQAPYLFVKKLELRRNRSLINASTLDDADELKITLEAFGYMLIE